MNRALRGIGTALLFAVVLIGAYRAVRSAAVYLDLPGEPPPGEAGFSSLTEWDLLRALQQRDRLAAAVSIPVSLDPFRLPPEEEGEKPPKREEPRESGGETRSAEEPAAVAAVPAAKSKETPPSPSPFLPDRPEGKDYAIPVVASRTGAGSTTRVVLDFGTVQSPLLAEGEIFRDWQVSGFSDERIFLFHRGVTYTLPLP